MPTQKDVLTFLTTIKPQLQKDGIEQVGLFGSYAKNSATLTSDIDIAIKLNKRNGLR
jgi:predicted nucleotidyltransferase